MYRATQMQHKAGRTRGFTLVEVLVSLVILSIGLLGIAKLMLFSSNANDSAYLRSQATDLAYQILDDMRANSVQAAAGTYDTAAAAAPVAPGFTCIAVTCANLALYDVYQWKLRLNANSGVLPPLPVGALPNGQGSVVTNVVGAQTQVTITVLWDDTVAQQALNRGAAPQQQIRLETIL